MLIQLRPNPLTEVENDYVAVVKHQGTLSIEDIAKLIIAEGTESDELTLIDLFKKMERMIVRQLADGFMVDTNLYHAMATVSGVFIGKAAHFDPRQGHAIGIALNICPPALRWISEGTHVENIGPLPVGPEIGTVEDMYTHTRAGSGPRSVITPQRTLRAKGKYIRVASDDEGTHAADCGIWMISTTAAATRTRVPDREIITNLPTELLFTIPALTPGTYWLEIVTQSTGKGSELVREPRTVRFEIPLEVEQD